MTYFKSIQFDRNERSQDEWQSFQHHRDKINKRMLSAAKLFEQPSIVILGAGNCNDFCLNACQQAYYRIHLVDIDENALRNGTARAGVGSEAVLHSNWDLSNCLELMRRPSSWTYEDILAALGSAFKDESAHEFDVVMSTCVLSQLIESTTNHPGLGAEQQAEIALRTRRRHLGEMIHLLRPRGIGILIADFVSSDTCPDLLNCDESHIPLLARRCLENRNFFTGVNPIAVCDELRSRFQLQPMITQPWRWRLGNRAYLVVSIEFRTNDPPKLS